MRHRRLADCCYGAAIVTMPLVGVGLVRLTAGVDLGAGLQPSYLLLALAWLLRLGDVAGLASGGAAPTRTQRRFRRGIAWGAPAVAAVLLSGFGLLLAPAPLLAHEAWPRFLKQTVQLAAMVAFLAYPALWTCGPRRWRWTLALLAWSTLGQIAYAGLLALHQLVDLPAVTALDRATTSNPAILAGSERLYLGGFTALPRLRGSMCEPLYLGSYLVAVLPLLSLRSRRLLPALAAVALLLTWSRGAWLAGVGGLLAWWLLRRRAGLAGPTRPVLAVVAGVLAAGAALVLLLAGPDALLWPAQRIAQTLDRGDWSNLTRFYSIQAAWRCFLESPVVGVGWGQFPFHFYALVDLPGLESQFTWPVVNSVPLLVLCETGLVGSAVLGAVMWRTWRATWRALAEIHDPHRASRLAAAAAASFGLALQLLVFSQYNLPHLWFVPGLWLAAIAEQGDRR